jgi:crotonobetainyl-CoA:carnitine CoA-transferase CaiB-like acyl-CoA transferase
MDCDVSLFDTAVSLLTYPGTWHLSAGFAPERTARSAHPSLVPFQAFPTADGWIVIACPKEKFWLRLVAVIGARELEDERFATFDDRFAHRDEVVELLDRHLAIDTAAVWIERLTAAGVPCGPVSSVAEAFDDAHTLARGMVVEYDHPELGRVRQPGSAVRVGNESVPHRRAPMPNEDADYVLRDLLGYGDERVAALREGGVGP